MNFAIGNTEYYDSLGFDTTHWRKSLDGTQSVVHYDTVQFLADESEITIYRHDDEAFREVMLSAEWTEQVEEDTI